MKALSGACDALVFAVNEKSGTPYRSGVAQRRAIGVEEGWLFGREITNPWLRLWRNGMKGDVVCWDYLTMQNEHSPFFWAIYNSGNTVDYFWESEYKPDSIIDLTVSPIHTTYPVNQIPAGGASARVYLPTVADLTTLETTVSAASLPAWSANTSLSELPDTLSLLNRLFMEKQLARNMRQFYSLTDLNNNLLDENSYTQYNLLWLRSASQILHDHRAETCIPVVKNNLEIDTATGYLLLP